MINIIPDNYLHVNIIIVSYLPYHFAQCTTLCCLTELAEFFLYFRLCAFKQCDQM